LNKNSSIIVPSFRLISKGAAIIIGLTAVIVIIGWIFDIPVFKSVNPDFVTMKANTAISFLLIGLSLLLLQKPDSGELSRRRRSFAYVCAFIVSLIGLLTLSEYIFGWNLGIDQLLFKELPPAVGTFYFSRMAPNTALNFLLIGICLLLLDVESKRGRRPSQWLLLIIALISLLALIGYMYGVKSFYGRFLITTAMAVHTAVLFNIVWIGILFARPDRGVMVLVAGEDFGGLMLRRLLPAIVIISLMSGFLEERATQAGLWEGALGASARTMINITLFAILIWFTADLLRRKDIQKKHLKGQWNEISDCSNCDFWSFNENIRFKIGNRWF